LLEDLLQQEADRALEQGSQIDRHDDGVANIAAAKLDRYAVA